MKRILDDEYTEEQAMQELEPMSQAAQDFFKAQYLGHIVEQDDASPTCCTDAICQGLELGLKAKY